MGVSEPSSQADSNPETALKDMKAGLTVGMSSCSSESYQHDHIPAAPDEQELIPTALTYTAQQNTS